MSTQMSFTLRGALLLIGVALFTLAGFLFRQPALLSLCVLLMSLVVLAALLSWWNMQKLDLLLENPARVDCGKKCEVTLSVKNARRFFDSVGIAIQVSLSRGLHVEGYAEWIGVADQADLRIPVVPPQRDCVMQVEYVLASTFPFGLFRCRRKGVLALSPPLLVLPKSIVPRELRVHGELSSSNPERGFTKQGEMGDLHGIRPWRSGDASKHIHWPASARSLARGHDLRVRECEPPGFYPEHCQLVFHSYGTGGALLREDRFERALAFLAGTLRYFHGLGVRCTLQADFLGWRAMPCGERAEFLEILALLAQTERCVSTEAHDLQRVLDTLEGAVVVLSEIENEKWQQAVKAPVGALLVDITQVQFKRKRTQHGKEVQRA